MTYNTVFILTPSYSILIEICILKVFFFIFYGSKIKILYMHDALVVVCLRSLFVFQAGGLLTQVTTLLNTFKNSSVGRYMSYAHTKTKHIKKAKSKTEQNLVTTSDLETGSTSQVSIYTWVVTACVVELQEFLDMIDTLHLL